MRSMSSSGVVPMVPLAVVPNRPTRRGGLPGRFLERVSVTMAYHPPAFPVVRAGPPTRELPSIGAAGAPPTHRGRPLLRPAAAEMTLLQFPPKRPLTPTTVPTIRPIAEGVPHVPRREPRAAAATGPAARLLRQAPERRGARRVGRGWRRRRGLGPLHPSGGSGRLARHRVADRVRR